MTMATMLVYYGTTEGHSARIAGRIADVLRAGGHAVDVVDGRAAPRGLSLGPYDGVIVGASIHGGRYPDYVHDFVVTHRLALERRPAAFFTVCLTAASVRPDVQHAPAEYVERFLADTGWQPTQTVIFAGALRYTRYNLIMRWLMRLLARSTGLGTDMSRDHEYTDWAAVERFAKDFSARLSPTATSQPTATTTVP